eukprot:4801460-Pleurochrysis_carterae.AAC.1
MQRCRWHASQANSQGVHACQTILIQSSQPTTVAKKNEKMGPKHKTCCMRGPEVQQVVHALCQCFSGSARAPQATVQPSRE